MQAEIEIRWNRTQSFEEREEERLTFLSLYLRGVTWEIEEQDKHREMITVQGVIDNVNVRTKDIFQIRLQVEGMKKMEEICSDLACFQPNGERDLSIHNIFSVRLIGKTRERSWLFDVDPLLLSTPVHNFLLQPFGLSRTYSIIPLQLWLSKSKIGKKIDQK